MPFIVSQDLIGAALLSSTMIVDSISLVDEQIVYAQPKSNYCYQIPVINKTYPRSVTMQTYCNNDSEKTLDYARIDRDQK